MVNTRKVRLDEDYDWFVGWYEDMVKQERAERAPKVKDIRSRIIELKKKLHHQRRLESFNNKLSSEGSLNDVIEWFEEKPEDEKIRKISESYLIDSTGSQNTFGTKASTGRLSNPCGLQGPNGIRFYGSVCTLKDLPCDGSQGDICFVEYDRRMYAWDPSSKTWLQHVDRHNCQTTNANAIPTVSPPPYLGKDTATPIDPIRNLDSYNFIKYLHEASPEELESGTITESTFSRITGNCQ